MIGTNQTLLRTFLVLGLVNNFSPGLPFCLELTLKGWRVTSQRHDCMQGDFRQLELYTAYFDTLNKLLESLSEGYKARFKDKLDQKLRLLQAFFHCAFNQLKQDELVK